MPPAPADNTAPSRKAIPKRVRFEVLRRDNYTCRYCRATDAPLTIDHVIPTVLGGTDDPSNLVACCKDCNTGKASSSPDESTVAQVNEDAIRWAAAIRLVNERAKAQREERQEILMPLCNLWYEFVPNYKVGDRRWMLPSNWEEVLWGLLDSGLSSLTIADCMRVALTTRGVDERFRYFIGIARNRLAELHQQAQKLIENGEV
jgi:hypothetical protein